MSEPGSVAGGEARVATPPDARSLKGEVAVADPTRHERSIARRSAEIRATVPHAEFSRVLDVSAIIEAGGDDPPLAGRVLAAVAAGLRAVPALNGAYRDGRLERYSRVNLGVVVIAEGLFVVPTLFDADAKSVAELDAAYGDLVERARDDRLEPGELTGSTFTVGGLARYGIHAGAPLVLGGLAGALTVGAPRAVPVVRDGAVVPGFEQVASLSVDHRAVQAHGAGRFLSVLAAELEAGA